MDEVEDWRRDGMRMGSQVESQVVVHNPSSMLATASHQQSDCALPDGEFGASMSSKNDSGEKVDRGLLPTPSSTSSSPESSTIVSLLCSVCTVVGTGLRGMTRDVGREVREKVEAERGRGGDHLKD